MSVSSPHAIRATEMIFLHDRQNRKLNNNAATPIGMDGSSGAPHSGGGLGTPKGIALDAAGNVWVANFGNSSVTELSSSGNAIPARTASSAKVSASPQPSPSILNKAVATKRQKSKGDFPVANGAGYDSI